MSTRAWLEQHKPLWGSSRKGEERAERIGWVAFEQSAATEAGSGIVFHRLAVDLVKRLW